MKPRMTIGNLEGRVNTALSQLDHKQCYDYDTPTLDIRGLLLGDCTWPTAFKRIPKKSSRQILRTLLVSNEFGLRETLLLRPSLLAPQAAYLHILRGFLIMSPLGFPVERLE